MLERPQITADAAPGTAVWAVWVRFPFVTCSPLTSVLDLTLASRSFALMPSSARKAARPMKTVRVNDGKGAQIGYIAQTPADIVELFDLNADRFKVALREIGAQILPFDELITRLVKM